MRVLVGGLRVQDRTRWFQVEEHGGFETTAAKRFRRHLHVVTGVAGVRHARITEACCSPSERGLFFTPTCSAVFLATCTGVLTMHWLEQLDFDAGDFARARFGTHRDFGLHDRIAK